MSELIPFQRADTAPVAEWIVTPCRGYECRATFFEDGTAEFLDEPARHRGTDAGSLVRKLAVAIYSGTDRELTDELSRYTRVFRVPRALLEKIVAAHSAIEISSDGKVESDVTPQAAEEIDAELNSIFWREINPQLTDPLPAP